MVGCARPFSRRDLGRDGALVGDFYWERHSLPLTRTRHGDDNWAIPLELEKGQSYPFRYLVNGQTWVSACNADDYVPNPLGGSNAVVRT